MTMTIDINIDFVTIPQSEYALLTKAKDSALTSLDGEMLTEHSDIFIKFLKKTQFAYQVSLSEGKARWKEEGIYNIIQGIDDMIKALKHIPVSMATYHEKKAQEQQEKKDKEKLDKTL